MHARLGKIRTARLLLILGVLTLKSFDPASCIDQLLLASEERVAFGAYFQVDVGLRGSGAERLSAGAGDDSVDVIGMDTVFHRLPLYGGRLSLDKISEFRWGKWASVYAFGIVGQARRASAVNAQVSGS